MAGTYADQAALAGTNSFITLVQASLIKRAVELKDAADAAYVSAVADVATAEDTLAAARTARDNARKVCELYNGIIASPSTYATRMAHLVAETNATIGASAPAVPSEGDTQYAVNTLLPTLVG